MNSKLLPLIIAPLVFSCGCPSKETVPEVPVEPTATPTVSVTPTVPEPVVTVVPKPEAPTLSWKSTSDPKVMQKAKEGVCFVVQFRSDNEEMNSFMNKLMKQPEIVEVVSKEFVPAIWDGPMDARVNYFGIPKDRSMLLVIPVDDEEYLLFDPFDEDGLPKGSLDEVKGELTSGLNSPHFDGCEDTIKSVVSD